LKGSSEILGGYNPIAWKSDDSFATTEDSFVFSFNDTNRNENHILSRVIDKKHAIDNRYYHGPSFGLSDLNLYEKDWNDCRKCCYEKSIRETEDFFSVDEYEVFQIIRD